MPTLRSLIFAAGFASLGAIAALGTQAAAGAYASGPLGPDLVRLTQALDLSAEQEDMVDEMRAEARAQLQARRDSKQADKEDIKAMLSQETLDAEAVHRMIDAHISELASFTHDMADNFIALHATLDADQRATLIEKMEAASARHEERRRRHIEQRGERGNQ